MNEKIITVLIGLTLGVLVASGVLFGPQIASKVVTLKTISPVSPDVNSPVKTTEADKPVTSIVSIDSPVDNFWATESTINVAGKTTPDTRVIIFSSTDEVVAISDNSGLFSSKIKLEEGENLISATIFDLNGNNVSVAKSVVLQVKSE